MGEWRLFPEGEIPYFTTKEFFDKHPWISPVHQNGYQERTDMAERQIRNLLNERPEIRTVVDLGCGDGDLLFRLRDLDLGTRGLTGGIESVRIAQKRGLDVLCYDFVKDPVIYGDLTIMTEVLEHLADPHAFLPAVASPWLLVTSPSAEDGDWHYVDHAWAWDLEGYAKLVAGSGWEILDHVECDAAATTHCGELRPQRFQAITARRV
jgi:hypothetical protein